MRFLPLLILGACAPGRAQWAGVPVTSAWLDDFDLSSIAAVAGAVEGDALLEFDGPEPGALPVHLGGGTVGAVMDFSIDPEGHDGSVDLDLSDVDDPTVGDLLGTYHGSAAGGAVVIGGEHRRMRNGRGAGFDESDFALGLSVWVGFEWVTIAPGGDDGGVDTGAADTGTAPEDTGSAGSESTWSSAPERSDGCGSRGCDPCGCSSGSGGVAAVLVGGLVRRRRRG